MTQQRDRTDKFDIGIKLIILLIPICVGLNLLVIYYDIEEKREWEPTGEYLKNTIIQQIHDGRSERGLMPVSAIDIINTKKITITDKVDIDNPSITPFESLVFDKDMKYISVTVYPYSVRENETTKTYSVAISGVW